jgi:hypothetical protein
VRGLAAALAVFTLCAGASSASTQRQRRLIGSYGLVTRIVTPSRIVGSGSLSIDTYNPATGAITGHGFDDAEIAPASMTGTVHGSTVTMRVVNRYGVASDRGTVYPNGMIRGTITAKVGKDTERGTWRMTPFELVVRQTGFSLEHFGHQQTDVTWGLVIQNLSTTRDARNVRVIPDALNKHGLVVSGIPGLGGWQVPVIPAGTAVYIGGDNGLQGFVRVVRVRASITQVSSRPTHRYVLPPVFDVKIDRANRRMTATLINPYRVRMSTYDYTPSVVFYDHRGRIIGGSNDGDIGDVRQSQWIKPGGRASVEIYIPYAIDVGRIGSARVTVLAD